MESGPGKVVSAFPDKDRGTLAWNRSREESHARSRLRALLIDTHQPYQGETPYAGGNGRSRRACPCGYPCWPGRSTTPRSPARVRTWSWARRMIALGGSCADVALRSLAQMSARSAPVSRSRWLHGYQRRRTGREAVAMPQCFATQPPSARGRYRLMPSRPGAALTVKPQVRASPSMAALWGNVVPTSAPMPLARA